MSLGKEVQTPEANNAKSHTEEMVCPVIHGGGKKRLLFLWTRIAALDTVGAGIDKLQ